MTHPENRAARDVPTMLPAPDGSVKALAAEGSEVVAPVTPEEFKKKFDGEYAALEKLIKAINIRIN